jgi:antiviral helicase SKI2
MLKSTLKTGRRGLDSVGTVIQCCFGEEPPPLQMLKQLLTGQSTQLSSQFRLTFNMILNLLRVEEMSVESMISRSFSEFATQRALTKNEYPQLLKRGLRALSKLEEKFQNESGNRVGVDDLETYFTNCTDLKRTNGEILRSIFDLESSAFNELFQPGRVVLISAARQVNIVRAPAIVLQPRQSTPKLVCMVLLPSSFVKETTDIEPAKVGFIGSSLQRHFAILEVEFDQILLVANKKRKIDARSLFKDDTSLPLGSNTSSFATRQAVDDFAGMRPNVKNDDLNMFAGVQLAGKKTASSHSPPTVHADQEADKAMGCLLEAEQDELRGEGLLPYDLRGLIKRGDDAILRRQQCNTADELIVKMRSCVSHLHPNLESYYCDLERKETLRGKVEMLQHLLSKESLQLFPDFCQRKEVLLHLGYVDKNETVCIKGRVACECNTSDELVVTEMVFEGLLDELEPEEIVAVLSALVYQGKSSEEELDCELPERLLACCNQMKSLAINLGKLQKELGLEVDPGEYCDGALKFGLVHVVYEWALGVPFKNICDLTDVQEGNIVRCITRLDELCREVRNCCRVIGNPTLYRKIEAASVAIKRDIVFASSLYVS